MLSPKELQAIRERDAKARQILFSSAKVEFQGKVEELTTFQRSDEETLFASFRDIPALLSHISELEAELEKKNKALEEIASQETNEMLKDIPDHIARVLGRKAQAALDSHPPFRHSQEV